MTRGLVLFGIWCLLVIGGYGYAAFAGYSPFADGTRSAAGARGPGGVFINRGGPRHK